MKYLLIAALLIFILLTGCGGTPLTRDQYVTKFNMEVVFVEDFSEVEQQFGFKNLAGLSVWGGETCYIFVRMPEYQEDDYSMMIIGHEFLHCVVGNHHK